MVPSTKEMNHGRSDLQKPNYENDNAKPVKPAKLAKLVQPVAVFGAEGVVKFFR